MPDIPALLPVFNALPGAYLLLSSELVIEAASNAYLSATLTQQERLVGRYVFDVFPDNPEAPQAHAVRNLRASLEQVLATGKPSEMPLQHYDVPDPGNPGRFVERYWLPRNTPVLDAEGRVQHIIHAVVNVTPAVKAEAQLLDSQRREQEALANVVTQIEARQRVERNEAHLQQVNQELGARNFSLAAAARTAEFAQAAAEAQRQRLHDVLLALPAHMALFRGSEHVYDFINLRYQQLFSQRNLLGRPLLEAIPELKGQPHAALLDHVYQTGEPYYGNELETWADYHSSGRLEKRYFNVLFQATRDAQGRIDGLLSFAYDVTEQVEVRRQVQLLNEDLATANEEMTAANEELQAANADLALAQQQLRQLNQHLEQRVQARTEEAQLARAEAEQQRGRLERLFMLAPAAICILDGPELVFELANPAYRQLFRGRELLGKSLLQALPELSANALHVWFRKVYDTGVTHHEQSLKLTLARPEDGVPEDRYFNFTLQARTDHRGQVDGMLVFAFEVTPQVQASQLVRATLDSSADMIQVFEAVRDGQGTVVDFRWTLTNTQVTDSYGTDLVGKRLRELNPGVVEAGIFARFVQVLETGDPQRYEQEYRHEQFNGWFEQSVVRLNDGLVTTTVDITDRKLAEQQIQAANEQLRRTNVDLDNFIYTASHDLKAPIANIEGLVYALEEQLPNDPALAESVAPLLTMMQDSVERFKRTIEHLSDVIKLQKEYDQPATDVSLQTTLNDVLLDLQPLIEEAQAEMDIGVGACPSIAFSARNLRSVMYNLISNALKYRHPDRTLRIRIHCHQTDDYSVLVVRDNGLGLEANQLKGLFGMFRRFHNHVEGSGIGLYMVKRSVENAGGKVEVESQPGEGTTFSVYFRR